MWNARSSVGEPGLRRRLKLGLIFMELARKTEGFFIDDSGGLAFQTVLDKKR